MALCLAGGSGGPGEQHVGPALQAPSLAGPAGCSTGGLNAFTARRSRRAAPWQAQRGDLCGGAPPGVPGSQP